MVAEELHSPNVSASADRKGLTRRTCYDCGDVAGSVGLWPRDTTNTPRSSTLQPSLLQFDYQLDGRVVRVINLADVHCERFEPAQALLGGPFLPLLWNLIQEGNKQRIKIQTSSVASVTTIAILALVLIRCFFILRYNRRHYKPIRSDRPES